MLTVTVLKEVFLEPRPATMACDPATWGPHHSPTSSLTPFVEFYVPAHGMESRQIPAAAYRSHVKIIQTAHRRSAERTRDCVDRGVPCVDF